jgi:hypothetical protein
MKNISQYISQDGSPATICQRQDMMTTNNFKHCLDFKSGSLYKSLLAGLLVAVLVGCGGGGGGGTSATTTTPVVQNAVCPGGVTNAPPLYGATTTVALCPTIFVDPAVALSQNQPIINSVAAARASDLAFYGSLQSTIADVIECSRSTSCGQFFAGPSDRNTTLYANSAAGSWVAPRMTVIMTDATYNRNQYVMAHEFSHVEVFARMNGNTDNLPAWFNEGLATYVGGEPDCTGIATKGVADLRSLGMESTWVTYTNSTATFTNTYCQARGEVAAWVGKHGNAAVNSLLSAVSGGQNFNTVYGPMQTQ